METEVIVSLITVIGSALFTFAGVVVNSKLTTYRIEQLEKKQEKNTPKTGCPQKKASIDE